MLSRRDGGAAGEDIVAVVREIDGHRDGAAARETPRKQMS